MYELISVIVPVYNAEDHIGLCISSLINQTYQNLEIILINDGSTDSSLEICNTLSSKDVRIKVIDRKNGGASAARNLGLKLAKGDYIVFVDSDDFVSRTYIENLYLAAKSGGYDIVQCDLARTSEKLANIPFVVYNGEDVVQVTKEEALNKRLYKVSVWGKIYSTHVLANFQFKEGVIYEDDASYYIFVDRAEKIAVLKETLYFYYMSENSVMRNSSKNKSLDFIDIYEERIRYFKQKNNEILLDGSYDRYALVLMLFISSSVVNGTNREDLNELIKLFKRNYKLVKKSKNISLKNKFLYLCFNMSPKIVGRFVGFIRKKGNS